MKVYAIVAHNFCGYRMFGIYSDLKKAQSIAKKLVNSDYVKDNSLTVSITEGILDDDSCTKGCYK